MKKRKEGGFGLLECCLDIASFNECCLNITSFDVCSFPVFELTNSAATSQETS